MSGYDTIRAALDELARDSMDSSLAEVLERDDDGQITVAFQTIATGLVALEAEHSAKVWLSLDEAKMIRAELSARALSFRPGKSLALLAERMKP